MNNFNITEALTKEEIIAFSLRYLYKNAGYEMFRMSQFEEYDFYAKNKDFLFSENIITFTDTDGRLMALKPDITLSIVKSANNTEDKPTKVFYNENVYRISRATKSFKELMQAGLECIGNLKEKDIVEVISLAAKSLDVISENNVLELSNLDILSGVLDAYSVAPDVCEELGGFISEKNYFGVIGVCEREGLSDEAKQVIGKLATLYGPPSKVKDALWDFAVNEQTRIEVDRLVNVLGALEKQGIADKVSVDFSVLNNMKYYSGFAFRGFVEGIPTGVLFGGQYDKLMEKMHKPAGTIGFAVYLDELMKL